MKRYVSLACLFALALPLRSSGQEAGDFSAEARDYGDYFGDERPAKEGPHSLDEARKQGRGYTLGQSASAARRPAENLHTVQEGDTLWDISKRYFGEPWHWPELWSYNPEITNPHWIYPLDHVRLSSPAPDGAAPAPTAAVSGQAGLLEPKHGLPDDLAPRVTVPPRMLKDGSIFLRDQGYLDDEEIKASGQILAGNEENMLLASSDVVYVKFNPETQVSVGQTYTIFRHVKDWERDPGERGMLIKIIGSILVRSYDPEHHVARGLVSEALDPVERGMQVTLMDRRFDLVPPARNETNVTAKIIASVQPRALLSYGNVVFLDVGRDRGIKPGNRFFIVRHGDNWLDMLDRSATEMGNAVAVPEYHKSDLPKEVVAELRVVKVREKVTIALITRSDTDVFQGDQAEMRVGY